jgi:hypothetical protein
MQEMMFSGFAPAAAGARYGPRSPERGPFGEGRPDDPIGDEGNPARFSNALRQSRGEWNRVMAHVDFTAGLFEVYVDGRLQTRLSTALPRGWARIRIADGGLPPNRLFPGRLRIGTTRVSVEVPPRIASDAVETSGDTVRLLDAWRSPLTQFPAGTTDPEAIASDGTSL